MTYSVWDQRFYDNNGLFAHLKVNNYVPKFMSADNLPLFLDFV